MKNQAILTLLVDKQEILRVGADRLSPRGCEFICSENQLALFRDESVDSCQGRYAHFQVRLALFPPSGPRPQYLMAMGKITSVRRSAQNSFLILIQFDQVSQDGYRLIAEHLSDSVVTSINAIQGQTA